MTVSNELIDRLLADYKKPEDLIGENGRLKQLTKRLVERALEAEMAEHLGNGKNEPVANPKGNTRNGKSKKTLKGEFGELPIDIPRDRDGSFEPQIVPKHQTRWTGFDDKILSLYARGMTVREIQAHLEEMYRAEVSPKLISMVTDAVMDEAKAWQSPWIRLLSQNQKSLHMCRLFFVFSSQSVFSARFENQPPTCGGLQISEPQQSVNARHLCRYTKSKRRS
jgi:putative transposase